MYFAFTLNAYSIRCLQILVIMFNRRGKVWEREQNERLQPMGKFPVVVRAFHVVAFETVL